jgi:hypothetical protein
MLAGERICGRRNIQELRAHHPAKPSGSAGPFLLVLNMV